MYKSVSPKCFWANLFSSTMITDPAAKPSNNRFDINSDSMCASEDSTNVIPASSIAQITDSPSNGNGPT